MTAEDITEVIDLIRKLAHDRFSEVKIPPTEMKKMEKLIDKKIPLELKKRLMLHFEVRYGMQAFSNMLGNLRVECRSCVYNDTLDEKGHKKERKEVEPFCPYPTIRNITFWCPLYRPNNIALAKKNLDSEGKNMMKVKKEWDMLTDIMKEYYQKNF